MNQDLIDFFQEIICQKKIKDGAYVINLDEYADVGTYWIALFCRKIEIAYFDSFGVGYVPEEIKEFIRNKNIKSNIFRVQAINSIMCGCFCNGFIGFMLALKKLTDFTSMFSPYDFDSIIWVILKVNETDRTNLTDQIKVRSNEINKIENYFKQEINQKKSMIRLLCWLKINLIASKL